MATDLWWLLTSRQWTGPRPINAYVIEHRDGVVLFDTGQDRASVTEPDYFPSGFTKVLYDRLARFQIGPDETLSAGLDRLGYGTGDVSTAVLSHLHQDHIGGLGVLGQADIVVSQNRVGHPVESAARVAGSHVPTYRSARTALAADRARTHRRPQSAALHGESRSLR